MCHSVAQQAAGIGLIEGTAARDFAEGGGI